MNPACISTLVPLANVTRTKYSYIASTLTNWTRSKSNQYYLVYLILKRTHLSLIPPNVRTWIIKSWGKVGRWNKDGKVANHVANRARLRLSHVYRLCRLKHDTLLFSN